MTLQHILPILAADSFYVMFFLYLFQEAQEKTDEITAKFLDKEKDPLKYQPTQVPMKYQTSQV
jgi:hypothetical protein